jgi:transposase-like protein
MDKGYDSEKIHSLIREEIKADSIIPLRVRFSVVKRKFGETLRARKLRNQVKEVKIKLIVYNIDKKNVEIICIKLRISTEPIPQKP